MQSESDSFISPPQNKTRPDLMGAFGAVASTHYLASTVAFTILERGGNAYDAAVAAAFMMHLVEPHLNGPGGDLVALVWPRDSTIPLVLDGQGPAPKNASIEHFQREGLDKVPGSGALAAAIPGAVDAWLLLLTDFGSMELSDVLSYAIYYAQQGYPLSQPACSVISMVAPLFRDYWPSSAELWLMQGQAPRAESIHHNPAYAQVLGTMAQATGDTREARIAAARNYWQQEIGKQLAEGVAWSHYHDGGTFHRGVITADDIAMYRAEYDTVLTINFRGYDIYKAQPWSSGTVLLQILGILDTYSTHQLDPSAPAGIHHIIEAEKLAFADREAYYGPDCSRDLMEKLISAGYAQKQRERITGQASQEFLAGKIPLDSVNNGNYYSSYLPPLVSSEIDSSGASLTLGEPTVLSSGSTRGDTCHLDIVDHWGNAISATPSGGWLQSSPTISSVGFALGTRLQMSWLDPRSPSALRPGKKPRTTLSPTLIGKNGHFYASLGTPGGDQQDQWQVPYILRTLLGGYTPQEAIDAPTFHTTALPGSFWPRGFTPAGVILEERFGQEIITQLRQLGHNITISSPWSLGRLSSVSRRDDGWLIAAANSRGNLGYAIAR